MYDVFTRRAICASSLIVSALLAPCPAKAAPAEYERAAGHLAEPLYPAGSIRPSRNLVQVLDEEGPRLGYIANARIMDQDLRRCRDTAYSHASTSALALLSMAAIDRVQPDRTRLLRESFEAMVGDDKAEAQLKESLSQALWGEVLKGILRVTYRDALDGRRRAAWALWDAAAKHSGGQFVEQQSGIGVHIKSTTRGIQIARVLKNTPAFEAGLLEGDTIISIGGTPVSASTPLDHAVSLITGQYGTSVELVIEHGGARSRRTVRREARLPRQVLGIDFDSSWGSAFSQGRLRLHNHSRENLTDVTLFVKLLRKDGAVRTHTHFTHDWRKGVRLDALYCCESRFTCEEDLLGLDAIEITLMSDQGWSQQTYQYSGLEAERDTNRWRENIRFTAGPLQPETYWIDSFNQPSGMAISFDGISSIPAEAITVTIVEGHVRKSLRWTLSGSWRSGEIWKKSFRDERFDEIRPNKAIFEIELPGCREPLTVTWNR